MHRRLLLGLVLLAGCKNKPEPPPDPLFNLTAPGVNVKVDADGNVQVKQQSTPWSTNVSVQKDQR